MLSFLLEVYRTTLYLEFAYIDQLRNNPWTKKVENHRLYTMALHHARSTIAEISTSLT